MSERTENRPEADPPVGKPTDEVPTLEPNDACNAKIHYNGEFKEYCGNPAGMGTPRPGEGRCYECIGESSGPVTKAGKNIAKMNGRTHGLTSDPGEYHKTLDDPDEAEFVLAVSDNLEHRIRENTGSLDFVDRVLARRLAAMIHIAVKASEYVGDEGLFERVMTDDGVVEVENRMVEHIRKYNKDIVRILKDIGATKETEDESDLVAVWRNDLRE